MLNYHVVGRLIIIGYYAFHTTSHKRFADDTFIGHRYKQVQMLWIFCLNKSGVWQNHEQTDREAINDRLAVSRNGNKIYMLRGRCITCIYICICICIYGISDVAL